MNNVNNLSAKSVTCFGRTQSETVCGAEFSANVEDLKWKKEEGFHAICPNCNRHVPVSVSEEEKFYILTTTREWSSAIK